MHHKFDLPYAPRTTQPAAVDGPPIASRTRGRRNDAPHGSLQLRRDGWCRQLCPSDGCSHEALSPLQSTLDTPRSTRTALAPSDIVPNSTTATNEYLEPLQVMDQGFETRLWSLANRLIATLGNENNTSLTQNLLEDLIKKILDNKDQLFTKDIQAHLAADASSRRLAHSITNHMESLAEDLVVANTHPEQASRLAQEFLHHHGCSSWEQLDEKIRRLENDAYVRQFANQAPQSGAPTRRPAPPPTGTAFDANLIQLEQKDSATTDNTWNTDLSSLVATMNLCNGPSLEPFDGRGKRTFAEFLRDFRWRYGQLPDSVQRAYLSSTLIGNAKDVFNSLESHTQEGPFDGLLSALQQALTQTTHSSINTLTAHFRRCTRQANQSLTLYLTELELTAQRLYIPRDTNDKEFVEVTKANVLMENIHEKDLARDLLEVLNKTPSGDVFTAMKPQVLAFEATNELLKINMTNRQPQPSYNRPWVNNNAGRSDHRPVPPQPTSKNASQNQRQPFIPRAKSGHCKAINIDNNNDTDAGQPVNEEPSNPLSDIQPDWFDLGNNSLEPATGHTCSVTPDPGGSGLITTPRKGGRVDRSTQPLRVGTRNFGSYAPWTTAPEPPSHLANGLGPSTPRSCPDSR